MTLIILFMLILIINWKRMAAFLFLLNFNLLICTLDDRLQVSFTGCSHLLRWGGVSLFTLQYFVKCCSPLLSINWNDTTITLLNWMDDSSRNPHKLNACPPSHSLSVPIQVLFRCVHRMDGQQYGHHQEGRDIDRLLLSSQWLPLHIQLIRSR